MRPSKWDLVLDRKPVPLVEHLVDEVARLFARDLRTWPPEVEALEPSAATRLEQILDRHPTPPSPRLYAEAFRLTRLDLERRLDAYDDYIRNQRFLEAGVELADRQLLLFLSHFMTEQLLGLGEATEGRVARPRLLDVLERTRRYFFSTDGEVAAPRTGLPMS